jgi:hypothetical protein
MLLYGIDCVPGKRPVLIKTSNILQLLCAVVALTAAIYTKTSLQQVKV